MRERTDELKKKNYLINSHLVSPVEVLRSAQTRELLCSDPNMVLLYRIIK